MGLVYKRRGGRRESAEVSRARVHRVLQAVLIPQGKLWVTLVVVWRMDFRMNEGGL